MTISQSRIISCLILSVTAPNVTAVRLPGKRSGILIRPSAFRVLTVRLKTTALCVTSQEASYQGHRIPIVTRVIPRQASPDLPMREFLHRHILRLISAPRVRTAIHRARGTGPDIVTRAFY